MKIILILIDREDIMMITYGIIILITTLLAFLTMQAEKKSKNKIIVYIMKTLTILFPSIIAGIRYGIGTDYSEIYESLFKGISTGNIVTGRDFEKISRDIEIGYILINKIVIFFNGNFNMVMFICSLITNGFIYFGLEHYKNKINVPLSYFLYMILFYQKSFNIVRQMISVAIVFYAFKFLDLKEKDNIAIKEYKKYVLRQIAKYIMFVIIAGLFQRTTLIMLVIPIILFIYRNPKYKILKILSYIVLLAIICNFSVIGEILKRIEGLKYYAFYFSTNGESSFSINYLIRILPAILPYFLLRKEIDKDGQISLLYGLNVIGSILLLLAYFTKTYGERIALFFNVVQIILFSYYIMQLKILKDRKIFISVSILIILINSVIWYNDYILKKRDETVPYRTIFNIKEE